MADAQVSIDRLITLEGGYVWDPDDPGGETHWGISKRRYPEEDIKALTRARASALYARDFWHPLYGKLKQAIADKLIEITVHMDHGDARPYYETPMVGIRLAQLACRALGDPAIAIDGRFGPQTLQALKLERPLCWLAAVRVEQCRHYLELADAREDLRGFLRGWIRRTVS